MAHHENAEQGLVRWRVSKSTFCANLRTKVGIFNTRVKFQLWPHMALWRLEVKGLVELIGLQHSSRFSKRPHLKGIKWRVIGQDSQHPPLVSTCTGHMRLRIHAYHIHEKKMNSMASISTQGDAKKKQVLLWVEFQLKTT